MHNKTSDFHYTPFPPHRSPSTLGAKTAIFSLLLLATLCVRGQEYPFIRYEANELKYDSSAVELKSFFRKWQRVIETGQGTVNIIHIGGSHVQAGTFPHRVRTNILKAYPNLVGGRGLIFPYSAAANCNNPADYKVHCVEKVELTRNVYKVPEHPLGLCGVSVTAHDVHTRIQILSNDRGINYDVNRIVLLGYTDQGVVPSLSYDGYQVPPSYVDSVRHRFVFNLRHAVDSFDIVLPCDEGQSFTLTGIDLGSRHSGVSYHSIGVNGAAVPDYLKCRLTDDLRLVRPDMVIFGIGINDAHGATFDSAAFRRNYMKLCDSIRSVNPECAFVFITNNDCYRKTGRRSYHVNTNGLLVQEVCYRLATATHGAVWDQFEIMGGLKSMQLWQNAGLAKSDKVHFTHAGYQLLGDMLFQALDKELHKDFSSVDSPASSRSKPAVRKTSNEKKDSRVSDPSTEGLPRGLRRKPHYRPASSEASSTKNNSNNINDSERFPYISD